MLRLRGDYLAIVTLGFGEMIRIILLNWYDVTGGPDGISRIPRPSLFGLEFTRNSDSAFHKVFGLEYSSLYRLIFLYYLILILALITNWATLRLRRLPIGRAWEALREDEIASRALGLNPTAIKLSAFAIGAMFGGFAGAFFATRQGFISPESFTFIESAIILAIVVMGGMGSQVGVVIAAIVMIGLPEWFRDLQEYRMLLFGAGMVLIMVGAAPRAAEPSQPDDPAARQKTSGGHSDDKARRDTAPAPCRALDHALWRPDCHRRPVVSRQDSGEITAIIGPNGAGKTTVFNCLTGFYKPTVGRLSLNRDGHDFLLERMEGFDIARHAGVARTFQNIRLFPTHERAGELAGSAAPDADAGLKVFICRAVRPAVLQGGGARGGRTGTLVAGAGGSDPAGR